MKKNNLSFQWGRFLIAAKSLVYEDKKKSLRIILIVLFSMGITAFIVATIRNYRQSYLNASNDLLMLLLFRNTMYLILFSIFLLFIWLSTTNIKIEIKFALLAMLLGICHMFINTPRSVSDELDYYFISYSLSNKMMFNTGGYGYVSQLDISTYPFVDAQNVYEGYIWLVENITKGNLFSQSGEQKKIEVTGLLFKHYFAQNLPQAVGITVARLLNGNSFLVFYSARFFNLVFYVFCGYLAVKKLSQIRSGFANTMLLIGLMPVVLKQAGSVSYDTFGNGLAFLLTACILCVVFDEKQLTKGGYTCIFLCSVLLAPFKLVYFPLCFLCLLIPVERFGSKQICVFGKTAIIACSLLFLVLFQIKTILNISDFSMADVYTPGFILQNPIQTIKMVSKSITFEFAFVKHFLGAVGINMSGSPQIRVLIYVTFLVVIILSTIGNCNDMLVFSVRQKIFSLLVILAVVFLIYVGEMLHYTKFGSEVITGVAHRYFIPIFPLFFAVMKNRIFIFKNDFSVIYIGITVILQCETLGYIVRSTIGKYQW